MKLNELPELTFVTAAPEEMLASAKTIVEGILGRQLERADPLWLFGESLIAVIVQQRLLVDELCKQNLLAYATGDNLEHIGALVGVERLSAAAATTTVEVRLSAARTKATTIPQGTRVSAGDQINFAIDENVVFAAGETARTVGATCVEVGEVGNGYAIGELNKIIAPTAFLSSIVNITASDGGADIETDDSLRERIFEAPEKFSTAGPSLGYEYWAKTASTKISDVYVTSERAGEVDVYVLKEGGVVPEQEMLNAVYDICNDEKVRPLTDRLFVKPPTIFNYNIELRYWIARSDQTRAIAIQAAAEKAVEDYVAWQRQKLGRDINPTELVWRLRNAGVKRVECLEPKFLAIPAYAVAIPEEINATFAGLEDD